ncbi:hypothetical protein, partial [Escherichia coli]|uniref:hypothetical protein n=1 Tax=Escherichia coli TaxID=562 RepID=UPI001BDCBEF9
YPLLLIPVFFSGRQTQRKDRDFCFFLSYPRFNRSPHSVKSVTKKKCQEGLLPYQVFIGFWVFMAKHRPEASNKHQ